MDDITSLHAGRWKKGRGGGGGGGGWFEGGRRDKMKLEQTNNKKE